MKIKTGIGIVVSVEGKEVYFREQEQEVGGGDFTCERYTELPTAAADTAYVYINPKNCKGSGLDSKSQVESDLEDHTYSEIKHEEKAPAGCFPCSWTKKRKLLKEGQSPYTLGSSFKKYLPKGVRTLLTMGGAAAVAAIVTKVSTGGAATGVGVQVYAAANAALAAERAVSTAINAKIAADAAANTAKLLQSHEPGLRLLDVVTDFFESVFGPISSSLQQVEVVQHVNVSSTTLTQASVASVAAIFGVTTLVVTL